MAIDHKPDKKTETEKSKPLQFRDNPEVKKRIDAFKAANPDDAAYYSRQAPSCLTLQGIGRGFGPFAGKCAQNLRARGQRGHDGDLLGAGTADR
jgi:hypothetical protein